MSILSKKQMSEEDIKLNYITPAIQPGWSDHITMETKITDAKINLRGKMAVIFVLCVFLAKFVGKNQALSTNLSLSQ